MRRSSAAGTLVQQILHEIEEMSATKNKRLRLPLPPTLVCSLLFSVLVAMALDVRAALAVFGQSPIEPLHVPELDAGFHLLYELKPKDAHNAV